MKELYCYSDFPMPGDFPIYPHHSKILAYLRMYADHFRLEQYIRFETKGTGRRRALVCDGEKDDSLS